MPRVIADDYATSGRRGRPSVQWTTAEREGSCNGCSARGPVANVRLRSLTFRVCPECAAGVVAGLAPRAARCNEEA